MSLHIAVAVNDASFTFPLPVEALMDSELFLHHVDMIRELTQPSVEDETRGHFVAVGRHRNTLVILGPFETRSASASAIVWRGFDPDDFAIEFHEPKHG